jgi:serine/threonine-protein kinase
LLHPPGLGAQSSDAGAEGTEALTPLETEPYALQIGAGQDWLRKGKTSEAVVMFKAAFKTGGSAVARSMVSHTDVLIEENENGALCRLTGLGRPRPFELSDSSSRPTVAVGTKGLVVSWADGHIGPRHQAFASLLDNSLRRISPAHAVTPEAQSVRHPQLTAAGEKLALIYWDAGGPEPGVYVRLLEADGRIASPARRVSAIKRHPFYPALTRAEDGSFWAVWDEETEGGGTDIMGRKLSSDLKPAETTIRLTALAARGKMSAAASKPDLAVAHGYINMLFSLQRSPLRYQVMLLRLSLDDPQLKTGVRTEDPKKGGDAADEDRYVGSMRPVSTAHGKNNQPRIACVAEGCLGVWDDETAGASAAFIEKERGEPLWHREFAAKGSRPAISSSTSGAAVAWYENSRLKLARISRDGVGPGSILTRVSGFQPYPALIPGAESGEWYVAWRDYEAGHLESFVLRAKCQ